MSVLIKGRKDAGTSKLLPDDAVPSVDKMVVPGIRVSSSQNFMRGHGTYVDGDDLIASLAGNVEQVNRLISVKPINSMYCGEIGDVVVGRIVEVQQKTWKVDINSRLEANLMLSSVNLPGGELRRKSVEDELMMCEYLKEGDLISAEVQKVANDGTVSLHTRNLRYGKLSQGTLVKVSPNLVKRQKSHFHTLPCGVSVILGCNGNCWISPIASEEQGLTGGYVQNLDEVIPMETRSAIARLVNCVHLLAVREIFLSDTTLVFAYDSSLHYEIKELIKEEVAVKVAESVSYELWMKLQEG